MVFSSLDFIFRFMPIFLIIYFITPDKRIGKTSVKNIVLFLGSLVFYAVEEPIYVLLLLALVVVNYVLALSFERDYGKENYRIRRKILFAFSLILDIGVLFFFKYADFVILQINTVLSYLSVAVGADLGLIRYVAPKMPIGISFYTFQMISYMVDVYYRRYMPEKNFVDLGAYMTMFPQMIAGPIIRYPEVREALKSRSVKPLAFDRGLKVFLFGLGFKVLIANQLSVLWSDIERIGYESVSTPLAWLGAFSYSFQIYFDFLGYSLMAIGLGTMLGFRIPENFRDPYASRSVTEFWQRWHMTLGRWFREYVYFPLGGSRCSKGKMIRNLLVVWMLTGIWHGSGWNFILWGFGLFLMIALEKLFLKKYLDKWVIFSRIYMWCWIPVSWVVFAITDTERLLVYLSRMFPWLLRVEMNSNVNSGDIIRYGKSYLPILLAAVLFSVPAVRRRLMLLRKKKVGAVLAFLIFVLSVYCLSAGLDNPFLYYQF